MATHQLQYLDQCQRILFLNNGVVEGDGTHSQLLQSNEQYKHLIHKFVKKEEEEEEKKQKDEKQMKVKLGKK